MRIEDLQYHAPTSLDDACALLGSLQGEPRVIAGGTDVLADLKQGLLAANHLVSLAGIDQLKGVELRDDDRLLIGPLTTPNQLARSVLLRERLPALADAAASMAGNQIRNLATVGGNICSAVPSADLPPALLVADAEIQLRSEARGERQLPLADFFVGPRKTQREADEILAGIVLPASPPNTGSAYERFQRRKASALAVVGAAARVSLDGEGRIASSAVAIGAAAPTPLLVGSVAEALHGKAPIAEILARAGELAAAAVKPITDLRGTADYRRELASVLTVRALKRACARAAGE